MVDRRIDHVERHPGIHAEHDQQRYERRDDDQFSRLEICQTFAAPVRGRSSSAGTSTTRRSRTAPGLRRRSTANIG